MKRKTRDAKTRDVQLQNTQLLDIEPFQNSSISLRAEVFRKNVNPLNPFSGRESALHVTISNSGEKDIENAIVEAFTSDGLQLVDPGVLFGTQRRHVRLPQLRPGKSITYKLALRAVPSFTSGVVTIEVKSADWRSAGASFSARLGVARAD